MMPRTGPSKGDYRMDKVHGYLEIARAVAMRSTCLNKKYGAIVVKDDEIVSTGYNSAPRGMTDCIARGECPRIKYNIPRGTNYHYCYSVHAEMNALISGGRRSMIHGTIYLYGWDVMLNRVVQNPSVCIMCRRAIINAGLEQIIYADADGISFDRIAGYGYRAENVADWVLADEELPPLDQPGY